MVEVIDVAAEGGRSEKQFYQSLSFSPSTAVSAEVSLYTVFTNNRIYGLSYIIICYRIYIEKKNRISVLQQHRYGLNPRRESGIHGNLGSQAGNESQTRILGSTEKKQDMHPFYSSTGTV